MRKLSTFEVLEILNGHLFDQIVKCDLLSHAVTAMVNDEAYMRPGSDTMIKNHLSDMMYLTQRPQDLLMEHIEFLKTHEMGRP